ncbi:MAG: hypothetical protein AB7T10_08470 [bacterium]
MKTRIVLFIVFALTAITLSILFTLQYDIYSYHLWAYTAIKEGTHEVYNTAKYFNRACDYTHVGAYLCLFQGKVLSYIKPLEIGSAPFLFFYKIFPLAVLLLFLARNAFSGDRKKEVFGYLLSLPFLVSIIVNGQFDIAILLLLSMSIGEFEKKNLKSAMLLLLPALLLKQTAVIFAGLIILHYFIKSDNKKRFVELSLLMGSAVFLIVMLPFIIKGNIVKSVHDLFFNTFIYLPFSGNAFNLLSIFNPSDTVEHNFNIMGISLATYSIITVFAAVFCISFVKRWDIYKKMTLISIIWFNMFLGLREQHLLYPFFFISIYTFKSKKNLSYMIPFGFITIANIMLFNPSVSNLFFKLPYLPSSVVRVMSVIQTLLSLGAVILIIRERQHTKKMHEIVSFSGKIVKKTLVFLFFMILFAEFAPGFYAKDEKELFSDSMVKNLLVEHSKDKYIDLNIVSTGPFENYIGARLSNDAYFKIANFGMYDSIVFDAKPEFIDSGLIIINSDTFHISSIVKNAGVFIGDEETLTVKSISPKKLSQMNLYNVRVK